MTIRRVEWFRREPGGGTLYCTAEPTVEPKPVSPEDPETETIEPDATENDAP